jgi:hypothetical protein
VSSSWPTGSGGRGRTPDAGTAAPSRTTGTRGFAKSPAGYSRDRPGLPKSLPAEAIEAFAKDVVDFVIKRRMQEAGDA